MRLSSPPIAIRSATSDDRDAIWSIFRAVVATGDTWSFEPTTGREEALAYWFAPANRCFVAERDGKIVGFGRHSAFASSVRCPAGFAMRRKAMSTRT